MPRRSSVLERRLHGSSHAWSGRSPLEGAPHAGRTFVEGGDKLAAEDSNGNGVLSSPTRNPAGGGLRHCDPRACELCEVRRPFPEPASTSGGARSPFPRRPRSRTVQVFFMYSSNSVTSEVTDAQSSTPKGRAGWTRAAPGITASLRWAGAAPGPGGQLHALPPSARREPAAPPPFAMAMIQAPACQLQCRRHGSLAQLARRATYDDG